MQQSSLKADASPFLLSVGEFLHFNPEDENGLFINNQTRIQTMQYALVFGVPNRVVGVREPVTSSGQWHFSSLIQLMQFGQWSIREKRESHTRKTRFWDMKAVIRAFAISWKKRAILMSVLCRR